MELTISQHVAHSVWALFKDLYIECPRCLSDNVTYTSVTHQQTEEDPGLKFTAHCNCNNCGEVFEVDGSTHTVSHIPVKDWIIYTSNCKREEEETAKKMLDTLKHLKRVDQYNYWEAARK